MGLAIFQLSLFMFYISTIQKIYPRIGSTGVRTESIECLPFLLVCVAGRAHWRSSGVGGGAKSCDGEDVFLVRVLHIIFWDLLLGKTLTDTFPPHTQALASAFRPGQPLLTDSLSKLVWLIRAGWEGGCPLKGTVSRSVWPWKKSKWRWGDN